jgi:glycosyltransferase involved in cell wall biosynthesis
MQASLPVVAYDVGDVHAQVVDGATGFLVPPFDVGELARRAALLAEDPALSATLGAAGRRRFDNEFRYDAMVRAIDGIYRELLGFAPPHVAQPLMQPSVAHAGVQEAVA